MSPTGLVYSAHHRCAGPRLCLPRSLWYRALTNGSPPTSEARSGATHLDLGHWTRRRTRRLYTGWASPPHPGLAPSGARVTPAVHATGRRWCVGQTWR